MNHALEVMVRPMLRLHQGEPLLIPMHGREVRKLPQVLIAYQQEPIHSQLQMQIAAKK